MNRTNYNIFIVLAASGALIFFFYFYDVTYKSYNSSPESLESKDISITFELEGASHQLLGRFRKEVSSPYRANIKFETDIRLEQILLEELVIKSNLFKEKHIFHSLEEDEPELVEFEELDVGAEAFYSSHQSLPIKFDQKEVLAVVLKFRAIISGLEERHVVELNLIPSLNRKMRFLLPSEAKKLLSEND